MFSRFEARELLGEGGFGRVWRCFDRESQTEIALKELHRFDADSLLRFKNEFRSLSDVRHPHLVRLGELFEAEGEWAFSLEYVPGTDFLRWVRPDDARFDERRLRAALVGIVHGLSALHSLGLVHRDVKPENVRVTDEGRVVLLDFGLVSSFARATAREKRVLGSPAFMAPEQADSERVGPAADFYALGVMLFEALTGRLPFEGDAMNVLLKKRIEVPPRASSYARRVPQDLDELCAALLSREPAARPDAVRVLEVLLGHTSTTIPPIAPPLLLGEDPFVGRAQELLGLHRCFMTMLDRGASAVVIEGDSGIGKSALVRRFGEQVRERLPETWVLESRCHVAEQLAFKAFDSAVDELSRELTSSPALAERAVLSADAAVLPTLFPVLARVPAVARRRGLEPRGVERSTQFQAFAELLSRISAERPLLLAIDDMQWSDAESLALLGMLLDRGRPLRMLVVATVRPTDDANDLIGERLRELLGRADVTRIRLGALDEGDSKLLTRTLVGRAGTPSYVEEIVREAKGHPLFLGELARRRSRDGARPKGGEDLDAVLRARVLDLDDASRALLELLSVEGAPLPHAVATRAADVDPAAIVEAIAALRAHRLARPARRAELAVYHDRIREAVTSGLDPTRVQHWHVRLAEAWQAHDRPDAARIARHWLACRDPRAAPWLERAAREAHAAAAFERAADLYRQRLEFAEVPLTAAERHACELVRADALASAGRSAEAARVLLAIVEGAAGEDRRELLVRAAQRLLQAGEVRAGLAAAEHAFVEAGLPWPASRGAALAKLGAHRLVLALRGLDASRRNAGEISARTLAQLSVGWRLWQPLAWADWLRSNELASRHLRLALSTGHARHVAFALQAECVHKAMSSADAKVARAVLALSEPWLARDGAPELRAQRSMSEGVVELVAGDLARSERSFERAAQLYLDELPGEAWQLVSARGLLMQLWCWRGRYVELARAAAEWSEEARLRGDRFAEASYEVMGYGFYRALMAHEPERALGIVDRAMEPWHSESFGAQHLGAVRARALIAGYRGGEAAAQYWDAVWPEIRGALMARAPLVRELFAFYRAHALLGVWLASSAAERPRAAAHVRSLLRSLEHAKTRFGAAFGPHASAQLAWLEGDSATASRLARVAHERLGAMGHCWSRAAALLSTALDEPEHYWHADRELSAWHEARGFVSPEHAVGLALPIHARLREHMPR